MLKRKDEEIAILNLSEEGQILKYTLVDYNEDLAPFHDARSTTWLKDWWKRRAVPISQGHIKEMLEKKGINTTEEYLVKNLGLSLTDYYWIAPLDSGIKWNDINLFENDFHDDINIANEQYENGDIPCYTPNGSLQGSLEKCWTIRNGKRGMLKGNRDHLSAESINEVIASRLHHLQGFENYTDYKLIEIHGRAYHYGCFSEIFTSTKTELISAYDVVISEKKKTDINTYEHFISICAKNGLDKEEVRRFLEYQISTDFILSGRDRHLSNISILRDADTLKFTGMAPIYDSGKSLFVADTVPMTDKEMLSIQAESFEGTEIKLLSLVKDRSLVDVSKLPGESFIKEIYSLDSNITESRIDQIVEGYKRKVDLYTRWQKGEDLKALLYGHRSQVSTIGLKDVFI